MKESLEDISKNKYIFERVSQGLLLILNSNSKKHSYEIYHSYFQAEMSKKKDEKDEKLGKHAKHSDIFWDVETCVVISGHSWRNAET